MERLWLGAAGLIGLAAVGGDAAARHLLALDQHRLDLAMTAARYGLLHAAALIGLVALLRGTPRRSAGRLWLVAAGWCFIAGAVLFCGSLYLLAAGAPAAFAWLVPCGGTAFILGWAALFLHVLAGRPASPV